MYEEPIVFKFSEVIPVNETVPRPRYSEKAPAEIEKVCGVPPIKLCPMEMLKTWELLGVRTKFVGDLAAGDVFKSKAVPA